MSLNRCRLLNGRKSPKAVRTPRTPKAIWSADSSGRFGIFRIVDERWPSSRPPWTHGLLGQSQKSQSGENSPHSKKPTPSGCRLHCWPEIDLQPLPTAAADGLSTNFRGRGQVEVQMMLVDVADEVPLIGEGAVIVAGELGQHRTPRFVDAKQRLEKVDERLGR